MDLRLLIKLLLFSILTFCYLPGVIRAHGGGVPQLTNAVAGPYWVTVWTQPKPLRAGEAHFTIAVSEPSTSGEAETDSVMATPILDAAVRLRLESTDAKRQTMVAMASRDSAVNKLFYEVDIELPAEGQWQATISIEGPAGVGRTAFEFEALPPSAFNWWILLGSSVVVFAAAVWIAQKFQVPNND